MYTINTIFAKWIKNMMSSINTKRHKSSERKVIKRKETKKQEGQTIKKFFGRMIISQTTIKKVSSKLTTGGINSQNLSRVIT